MSEWDVSSLRLTVFPPAIEMTVNPDKWWLAVAGEPPDRVLAKPKLEQYRILGNYNEGQLSLTINPTRLDWRWTAEKDDSGGESEGNLMPVLGGFDEKVVEFQQVLAKWFGVNDLPLASRVAFGAVLLRPVIDRAGGYSLLHRYLHRVLQIDPDNSSDLIYQINRPARVPIGENIMLFNRLSKWSVAITTQQKFLLSPEGGFRQQLAAPSIAVRLELDINTEPNADNRFDMSMQILLLQEMIGLGTKIAEKGDIISDEPS